MVLGAGDADGEALVEAILKAFDQKALAALLRFKAGMVLEDEVNTHAGFRSIVQDLVVLLDQTGELDRFLAIALAARSGNTRLQAIAAKHGVAAAEAVPEGVAKGTAADFVAAAQKATPDTPLEALVARRSRLIDFARFQTRIEEMERRVCLIRVLGSAGTGFLVGPDLLLTNYHVVEKLAKGECAASDLVCEFDFNSAAAQTTRCALAGPPRALSPYGASDLSGEGEPSDTELDYALLPLADRVGDTRGFYTLDPLPRLLPLNDFMFVAQQAGARQLQLAMGTITDFPGKALRIRYDVTTEPGSSGSPCFTAELDLIGLHHAADPAAAPKYNQAVPLWLIARDAKAKGALA